MQPREGDSEVQIPISFDGTIGRTERNSIVGWVVLILTILFIMMAIVLTLAKFITGVIISVVMVYIAVTMIRFLVFQEIQYKKKLKEVKDNEYLYDYSLFWDIHDITEGRIPIYHMSDKKAIFMAFDKDVIVGKEYYSTIFNHHNAIAEAYKAIDNRKLTVHHIDYMDTLGSDGRMVGLFESSEDIINPDLKKLMLAKYGYMESSMYNSYASYDIYVFYSNLSNELFTKEVLGVVSKMKKANYIRYRALGKDEISLLVRTIMNLNSFSINEAKDAVFKKKSLSLKAIRLIWTESNGKRKKISNTKAESKSSTRVKIAEKEARKQRKRSMKEQRKNANKTNKEDNLF